MLRKLLTQTTNNNNTTSTTTMLTPPTNEAFHNVFINKDDLNLTNNLNNNNEKLTLVHADNTPEFVIFIFIKKKKTIMIKKIFEHTRNICTPEACSQYK